MRILDVPKKFMPKMEVVYPPHQNDKPMIEERFYNYIINNTGLNSNLIYIPIFWTQYLINQNYGSDIQELSKFINLINEKYKNDKFFTVVQYDGGTLVPINNSKIFACSGSFSSEFGKNSIYIPIPLLCEKHDYKKILRKKYLASFVGSLETHNLRKKMYDHYSSNKNFIFRYNLKYFKTYRFKRITKKSFFALCPRGYGPASFRFYESLELGTIPVYLSNYHWLPFNNKIDWKKATIIINENDINQIENKLNKILESSAYDEMTEYISLINEKFLNWNSTIKQILNDIC